MNKNEAASPFNRKMIMKNKATSPLNSKTMKKKYKAASLFNRIIPIPVNKKLK